LHGVARSGYATVFPQAIGLAATWNTPLIQEMADVISTEARAKYNEAQRTGNHAIYFGLTLWSPNINIDRDPRWGRGQETYGEDPYLTGQFGAAYVRGIQGTDPQYLKAVATPKHFAVHSGPESERHIFDAEVSPYDLADTYLPAFRKVVIEAKAESIMCAYNAVNGAPSCASTMLLQDVLRGKWHFDGYTVSDCAAITDISEGHRFSSDPVHGIAAALKAGTDLNCGKEYASLAEAVRLGLVSKAEIDTAVSRLLRARFRLGMFDPQDRVVFNRIPFSENNSAAHSALTLKVARESIVLLKNESHTLPLSKEIRSIAVVGPNASSIAALEGNYNAIADRPVTPLAALQDKLPGRVEYAQGSPYVDGLPTPVPETMFSTGNIEDRKTGLLGEYFNGTDFSGSPIARRVDRSIDFDWNAASPVPGQSSQQFSVRWSGYISFPISGKITFRFSLAHGDQSDNKEEIRVLMDGKSVYHYSRLAAEHRSQSIDSFDVVFADTKPHPIRIEYAHDAPRFGAGVTFQWIAPANVLREQAVQVAKRADATIAFLGLSPELEGEEMPIHIEGFQGGDRTSIELPAVQLQLIDSLAATGKPLVVVLLNGSALAFGDATEKITSILEAWYPGARGGDAIAETLFGENNPAGRLPVTFYASTDQLPAFADYSMKNRTYRYSNAKPLFPFGFGLSYTKFEYAGVRLSNSKIRAGDPLKVFLSLRNVGDRDGDEVVEIYLKSKNLPAAPLHSLVGFQRVHLAAGAKRDLELTIDPSQMSFVSPTGDREILPGEYEIAVGGGLPQDKKTPSLHLVIEGSLPLAP
jgi:beta-glucosidase